MNGLLLIDKPEGPTSAEVVRRIRRLVPGRKIGHLGTLDPFASGILPICVGEATKIVQFLNVADKEYEGTVRLGLSTDTGDRTGQPVRTCTVPVLEEQRLRDAEARFTGDYEQVPPMYSALKHNGVPLYKLARKGVEVERAPRHVRLASLQIAREGIDRLRFKVSCSKGTYIRVLAEDLGEFLRTAAHLECLRRTRFGRFDLKRAVALDSWNPEDTGAWLTVGEALEHLPTIALNLAEAAAVAKGQTWVLEQLEAPANQELVVLVDPDGGVVALVSKREGRWRFRRVFCRGGDSLQESVPMLIKQVKSRVEKRCR